MAERAQAIGEEVARVAADGHVERGQRLVQQKRAGARGERAGERDPLHLAARKLGGAPARQRQDVQLGERFARAALAFDPRLGANAVSDVAQHVEVREQRVALGHETDAAAFDGRVDAALAVEQRRSVEPDAAAGRRQRAQDHHQRGGLAGTVRPDEQQRRLGGSAERKLDRERADRAADVDVQTAHRRPPARIATSSANATATRMIDRLCAVCRSDSSAV